MFVGPEAENVTESGTAPPEIPDPFGPPNPDLPGPSTSRPSIARLDNVFNFQIVVFQVRTFYVILISFRMLIMR